jgi:hypothetical protein
VIQCPNLGDLIFKYSLLCYKKEDTRVQKEVQEVVVVVVVGDQGPEPRLRLHCSH